MCDSARGVFVTGTGTDMGKTYVAGLMVKKLHAAGLRAGYYKAAMSGASGPLLGDARHVTDISGIPSHMARVSYVYKNAVSPHLAARMEDSYPQVDVIKTHYGQFCYACDYITAEGSGGIVCPLCYEGGVRLMLTDVIRELGLEAVIVADAGLGTINASVLTAEYMTSRGIEVRGFIVNRYTGGVMQDDNIRMIEELTSVPVVAVIRDGGELDMPLAGLISLYK